MTTQFEQRWLLDVTAIEENASQREQTDTELTDAGKKLFLLIMAYGKAEKREDWRKMSSCQYQLALQRHKIAQLQNELYAIAPEMYPQFGSLG